jgi:hypothetical protein
MRLGYERLGGIVRERMQAEPRPRRSSFSWANEAHDEVLTRYDANSSDVPPRGQKLYGASIDALISAQIQDGQNHTLVVTAP